MLAAAQKINFEPRKAVYMEPKVLLSHIGMYCANPAQYPSSSTIGPRQTGFLPTGAQRQTEVVHGKAPVKLRAEYTSELGFDVTALAPIREGQTVGHIYWARGDVSIAKCWGPERGGRGGELICQGPLQGDRTDLAVLINCCAVGEKSNVKVQQYEWHGEECRSPVTTTRCIAKGEALRAFYTAGKGGQLIRSKYTSAAKTKDAKAKAKKKARAIGSRKRNAPTQTRKGNGRFG